MAFSTSRGERGGLESLGLGRFRHRCRGKKLLPPLACQVSLRERGEGLLGCGLWVGLNLIWVFGRVLRSHSMFWILRGAALQWGYSHLWWLHLSVVVYREWGHEQLQIVHLGSKTYCLAFGVRGDPRTKILEPPIHLDSATNYFTPSIEPPGI